MWGVRPQRRCSIGVDGRERFTREATVSVQFVKQELRPRNARFSNREVCVGNDALETLRLREKAWVRHCRGSNLEKSGYRMLYL